MAPIETQPRGQREGVAGMSPPRAKSDAVNLELSAFWVGLTHFVQQTGALGLLTVALIWGIPKILEERKDREAELKARDAIEQRLEGYMQRIDGYMATISENIQRQDERQRRGTDL